MTVSVSDQTILLNVRCHCPGHPRVPVRLTTGGLHALRAALNSHASDLPPDLVLQTYRCAGCQTVTEFTARDLHLAA